MNFFSDERTSELRDLFFESAAELLQALNEEGLELEKHPADPEIIRTMRRTVHTLKGDSAACGFRELSELAHELEDVLTPEIAARSDSSVVQVVLSAADTFEAMLAAHRNSLQLPDSAPLRELIRSIAQDRAALTSASTFEPAFAWSDYDELMIRNAAGGRTLFNVGIQIDPQNPFQSASLQLVRNTLREAGTVLASLPPEGADGPVASVEAVLATEHDQQWLEQKCRIPAVVSSIVVRPFSAGAAPAPVLARTAEMPDLPGAVASDNSVAGQPPAHGNPENILRVDADRVDTVLNLVGELIISRSMLHQAVQDFSRRFPKDPLRGRFADIMAQQTRVLNDLQRSVMKVRMVPVEQLFRRFPRVIRDVSKLTGKDIKLQMTGQNTDLDKSILDALAEPMTHLVRNAVDHGIETPEARTGAGKPAQGTIRLNAYYQANQVAIEISDDGGGIDAQRVAAKALATGVVTRERLASMSESEILELIFEPGFSTAPQVTEVSGRGVGLDVVKTVLDRMKGTVSVHTRVGEGTTFLLRVPLTLAIIKALMFRVGARTFAVPIGNVLEITRVSEDDIHRVDNHEVLRLREQVLPLVRLEHLGGTRPAQRPRRRFVVIVAVAGRKFGLMVDLLLGEDELVIKPLDSDLVSTDLVSGASIMGDGSVVLILNVAAVVEKSGRTHAAGPNGIAGAAQAMGAEA